MTVTPVQSRILSPRQVTSNPWAVPGREGSLSIHGGNTVILSAHLNHAGAERVCPWMTPDGADHERKSNP